jgi:3-dehydroquinate synthase
MERIIEVKLGERSYPIEIRRGIIGDVGRKLASAGFSGRVAVITNSKVAGLWAEPLLAGLKSAGLEPLVITMPDGEEHKTLDTLSTIYNTLIEHRFERTSAIIALGGGVVGDVAGFAAATYLRGVPYIQVPTTLLAQVDSSVGGKTAVNHPKGKNLIGAFYQPRGVYIDPDVLSTLDVRETRAGMAEVIKYGVIWDAKFFASLELVAFGLDGGDTAIRELAAKDELIELVARSCEIKAEVVGSDETEKGLRAILNFGHTFGHAIEAEAGYGVYRHGEAVAIGMVMAARYSVVLGHTDESTAKRIETLVESFGLPTTCPEIEPSVLMAAMKLDKKVAGAKIRFVLTTGLGSVHLESVDDEVLRRFLSP